MVGEKKQELEMRALRVAEWLVENKSTVRDTAKEFGYSKSTVHKDVTERLEYLDMSLYEEVRKVLDTNKAERHLRGGQATKVKYLNQKG